MIIARTLSLDEATISSSAIAPIGSPPLVSSNANEGTPGYAAAGPAICGDDVRLIVS
jgi:hypothetical protein